MVWTTPTLGIGTGAPWQSVEEIEQKNILETTSKGLLFIGFVDL